MKPDDPLALKRVLEVFERNYRISSAAFYRAHLRNETPAADLSPWHREIWSGTYRQWLRNSGGTDGLSNRGGTEAVRVAPEKTASSGELTYS